MKIIKIFILIVQMCFSLLLNAQSKTVIGASINPAFTKPFGLDPHYSVGNIFAMGGGINWHQNIFTRVFIKTGVGYKQKNERLKKIVDLRSIVDQNGNINYDNYTTAEIITNYHNIYLPLFFNFQLRKNKERKANYYLSTGFEACWLFSKHKTYKLANGNEHFYYQPNKMILGLGYGIGGGFDFALSEKTKLNVESLYFHDFYSGDDIPLFNILQINLGLQFVLR